MPGREARSRFRHNRSLPVGHAIKTFGKKNVSHDSRRAPTDTGWGNSPRRGFSRSSRSSASAQTGQAQEQGSVLQQGQNVIKQGAKLLGFATDVAPPADFVVKSRPAGDPDYIPVFQPPPEPAMPALKDGELKAVKSDLDALQKRHDALRQAYPPAAKALAEAEAAKKKPKTNAPAAQQ